MVSLETALENNVKSSYISVRCSSTYIAFLRWYGEEQLGKEKFGYYRKIGENAFIKAVRQRASEKNLSIDDADVEIGQQLATFSNAYLFRIKRDSKALGTTIIASPFWDADFKTCSRQNFDQ